MSGSGGNFRPRTARQTQQRIQSMERETDFRDYEADVCRRLSDFLRDYNQRDASVINERLSQITEILSDYLESSITTRFGGSVSKHTYVDGISDVDCLLLLKPSQFSAESPQQLLQELEGIIREVMRNQATVERTPLSLKVIFSDGPELQLLPALPTATGLRIPTYESDEWSQVIHPDQFTNSLTTVNQKQNGNVVPAIKIIKPAIENLSLNPKIKGYHIEALAVRIFQDYSGELNTKAMVQHFFERASDLIKTPIRDQTGQSNYIDDHFGPRNSEIRENTSKVLRDLVNRLNQADADCSTTDWLREIGA